MPTALSCYHGNQIRLFLKVAYNILLFKLIENYMKHLYTVVPSRLLRYALYSLSSSGNWRQSPPVPVTWLLFSVHILQSAHQTWERGSNRREERRREKRERERERSCMTKQIITSSYHECTQVTPKTWCYINLEIFCHYTLKDMIETFNL